MSVVGIDDDLRSGKAIFTKMFYMACPLTLTAQHSVQK